MGKRISPMKGSATHLSALESEAMYIIREVVAEARNPVMLFSAGKDSTVMAHLALRAFHPSKPPFPLLHVDSTWEFRSLLEFRDAFARDHGLDLIVYANEAGRQQGINPFDHGEHYTRIMRTDALKSALDAGGYDFILGGARRDEEKSRAKERIFSIRNANHVWDPRQQRPELWKLFNTRISPGQTVRVFPLSNWTENDVLAYALWRKIELAPLYFATPRPVVERGGSLVVVDDEARMRFLKDEKPVLRSVRFRTLGCWPVTGAIPSNAVDIRGVVLETSASMTSERQGRINDGEEGGSLEKKKQEGYF
ncbi:sulfate adenylyltransferase subunit CysD [Devosia psychrophila]|nr:sulfate adenylyltransferase subunit CysD [Devosia psychrophila]